MAGAGERQGASRRDSDTANSMVTNLPEGKSSTSKRFSRVSTSPGPVQVCASERNMPRVADISSAAAVPFPETSARTSPQQPSSKGMKSYQSPPTAPAGMDKPGNREAGNVGRTLGQQSLLDHACLALFLSSSARARAVRAGSARALCTATATCSHSACSIAGAREGRRQVRDARPKTLPPAFHPPAEEWQLQKAWTPRRPM